MYEECILSFCVKNIQIYLDTQYVIATINQGVDESIFRINIQYCLQLYSENKKTKEQEDDIIAILKWI